MTESHEFEVETKAAVESRKRQITLSLAGLKKSAFVAVPADVLREIGASKLAGPCPDGRPVRVSVGALLTFCIQKNEG